MGLKQSCPSTTPRMGGLTTAGTSGSADQVYELQSNGRHSTLSVPSAASGSSNGGQTTGRLRALSLGNFLSSLSDNSSLDLSNSASRGTLNVEHGDSDDYSTDEGETFGGGALSSSSLPTQLTFYQDLKCPVCHKNVPPDNVEVHLVICLTKPQIVYNEDILTEDKGECSICLDDLQQGDTIARLPCLCIYHKGCIDDWFAVNRSCPEHPSD